MTCFDEEPDHQPTKEEWEAYEAKIRAEKIRELWDEYGYEVFEIFDVDRIDNATIGEVLGQDVASEYSRWIYNNLK
jgi:hypothetical protein